MTVNSAPPHRTATEPLYLPADPAAVADDTLTPPLFEPAHAAERLYWARWMTGHQATIGIWTCMRGLLTRAAEHRTPSLLQAAADLTDAYTALLLYCGSCPRRIYEDAIRPVMHRFHPAFSGKWSRDHRALVRCAEALTHRWQDADPAPLTAYRLAGRRNGRAHIAVARTLVPDGVSLFRRHATAAPDQPADPPHAEDLFDAFFAVRRTASAPARPVAAQTCDRLTAILLDVRANDLYPRWVPDARRHPGQAGAILAEVEASMTETLIAAQLILTTTGEQ
ncbi:hypothetical protein Cs7R123_02940 [Catellatospora sp. TT07R-123]|uniref:hypothetical protein n=1 Tax=Catellatospora sp. TT07R-123 TaxID=2733863 RepID=UPI001B221710|nr:hypothetical protein [Catellatospora sp. TT07R-123]GHJ42952.1 hypothetical protein Cs7R123_02940 [Catellatospora sp. TT07R-123]